MHVKKAKSEKKNNKKPQRFKIRNKIAVFNVNEMLACVKRYKG